MNEHQETNAFGIDKIRQYKWTTVDQPGEFLTIHKGDLQIDDAYQRDERKAKVLELASRWSWVACGCIIVAERNGVYYVIDGQHRVMAARNRSDITLLPCIVFQTANKRQEASGFLNANTNRKPLTAVEKHKAKVVGGDKISILLADLLKSVNRYASGSSGQKAVRCLSRLEKLAKSRPDTLKKMLPLISEICKDRELHFRILDGMMWIETHLEEGMSLTQPFWTQRALKFGFDQLLNGANRSAAYHSKGSEAIWGRGILDCLNKGMRQNRELVVRD